MSFTVKTIKKCNNTADNVVIVIYVKVADSTITVNRIEIADDIETVIRIKTADNTITINRIEIADDIIAATIVIFIFRVNRFKSN